MDRSDHCLSVALTLEKGDPPLSLSPSLRSSGTKSAHTDTEPPLGVNLRALDIRFLNTWSILNLSMCTKSSLSRVVDRDDVVITGEEEELVSREVGVLVTYVTVTPASLACRATVFKEGNHGHIVCSVLFCSGLHWPELFY